MLIFDLPSHRLIAHVDWMKTCKYESNPPWFEPFIKISGFTVFAQFFGLPVLGKGEGLIIYSDIFYSSRLMGVGRCGRAMSCYCWKMYYNYSHHKLYTVIIIYATL